MEAVASRSQPAKILRFGDRSGAESERLGPKYPVSLDKQVEALHRVRPIIERVTEQFPVSEIVVSLSETFDWLQGQVPGDQGWMEGVQREFDECWEAVAGRALAASPRQVSDAALADADYDPFGKGHTLGVELTRVLRAVLDELGPVSTEAADVLPAAQWARAHIRAMETMPKAYILPVVAYAPLLESEWDAILDQLNELIELALTFEGAAVVWLIGGLTRDGEGRLQLRPKLSLTPPAAGTRVKPVRVLLGTAYEEQCPSLLPLVRAARKRVSMPAASLFRQATWHRLVVQLGVAAEYALLDLGALSRCERELAQGMLHLAQDPRKPHKVNGTVHEMPRPWDGLWLSADEPEPSAPAASTSGMGRAPSGMTTQTLLPLGMGTETDELSPLTVPRPSEPVPTPVASTHSPSVDGLSHDAEHLRLKGIAAATHDPSTARKYLLASTVLQHDNAEAWLALIEIAGSAKEREMYRQQAEKILSRGHSPPTS